MMLHDKNDCSDDDDHDYNEWMVWALSETLDTQKTILKKRVETHFSGSASKTVARYPMKRWLTN